MGFPCEFPHLPEIIFMNQQDIPIEKEVEEMLKPTEVNIEKTEAEISMEFLDEFKKLVRKYGRDFQQVPPQIIKVEFIKSPNENSNI